MSLIPACCAARSAGRHTCELNRVNPFDYLTVLQKHAKEAAAEPAGWMPWNYQETLSRSSVHAS